MSAKKSNKDKKVDDKETEETAGKKEPVEEEKSEEPDAAAGREAARKARRRTGKHEIKLFNRWSFNDVVVHDISLEKYINLNPIVVPHSGGKHEHKRFWKSERVNIVERFINKMLAPGLVKRRIKGRGAAWHAGKKQKCMKILENAFTIIEETTGQNPIQVLVDAISNAAPREETTRISLGGISYHTAVDISPQRRVDLGIRLLVQAALASTYNNIKTIDECIANELILAARMDPSSKAIKRKDEIERIALAAR